MTPLAPASDLMVIRQEKPADRESIRTVHEAAFDTLAEARLVEQLRGSGATIISLVAVQGGAIAGHILFSPISFSDCPDAKMMSLAPMAVLPAFQGFGVGSALVRAGLQACREQGVGAVVVLGHPEYYPRFGFMPAMDFGIDSGYDVPPEAFMAIELEPGYLQEVAGTAQYHRAFADL